MDKDLKALLAELVEGEVPAQKPASVLPTPEVLESDSEEAWNDFQNSQLAYDEAFHKSKLGSL